MTTLGLDIGGANIKAATVGGSAALWPFALWRDPDGLEEILRQLVSEFPEQPIERFAVTMTGEMCDCFANRSEGVHRILDAVERVADGREIRVWIIGHGLCEIADARRFPLRAAASNWNALATYVGRLSANAILIDTGSTTTDIIPIVDGLPVAVGRNDMERLRTGELVYTGVGRTPICAVLGDAVMAELFATTLDAYLILGDIAEDADDTNTADGRPATRELALARMARMFGGDADTFTDDVLHAMAVEVYARQRSFIHTAIIEVDERIPGELEAVIFSGSGEFLAQAAWVDYAAQLISDRTAPSRTVSLSETLGPELSHAACAYALAVLASENWA